MRPSRLQPPVLGNIPNQTIDEGQSFTTIELKTNFLGSAKTGERVSGRAVPTHVGRSTQVWDVEVRNETQGRVIALFRCTQMVLYTRAAPTGSG